MTKEFISQHDVALTLLLMLLAALVIALLAFIERREHYRKAALSALPPKARPSNALVNLGKPVPGSAGFTILSAMSGSGCLGRSSADEPVFVLCARDKVASMVVRDWADMAAKIGASEEKVAEARQLADRMERWRASHGGGKVPD